jgi:hypothetical protein
MDCPRCGASAVTTPECPACGVLVAKARPARPRPARVEPRSDRPAAWRSLVLPGIGLALVIAAAVVYLRRPAPAPVPAAPPPAAAAADTRPPLPAGLDPGVLPVVPPDAPPPSFAPAPAATGDPATEADVAAAARLSDRLRARARITAEDVRVAEGLYARHSAQARELLEVVLLAAAAADQSARRFDSASALVERAQVVAPGSPRPQRALLALRLEAGDWAAAERAGRAFLAPDDAEAARGVAYVLLRQDRAREAVELLTSFLDVREDRETRAFLERLQRDQAPEKGLDEAKLAHFHVRYDGDAHEEVGREILRLLDRHYATLARAFDHQPQAPIPVILLSRESYYDATGAPAWSGGQYDSFDGRVRIPIAGLQAALPPELDETLVHELTHSFVADLSSGRAPRELHEGLAQYMEGRRMSQLDAERLRALADGRLRGVSGFYFGALWFVEDLLAQRGQGGINDLLRAMTATGSTDEAFRGVYGRDFETLQRQSWERLRQRHGS